MFKRALDARERVLGLDHPDTIISVNNLASALEAQGRYAESLPLYVRAAEASRRKLGDEHPQTLNAINNLGSAYSFLERYAEAEPWQKLAFQIRERALGPNHADTIVSLNNLAELYRLRGRYGEALPLYQRAVEASGRALGAEHPQSITAVNNLGMLYLAQNRPEAATPLLLRALQARESALGKEHPTTLTSVNNLALSYFQQKDWTRAAGYWRTSATAIMKRTLRGVQKHSEAAAAKKRNQAKQMDAQFWGLAKAVRRASEANAAQEIFGIAQWAQGSAAAESLAQMAARSAKGDPQLSALVRERQDLVAEWEKIDASQNAALAQPAAKRDMGAEAKSKSRLAQIDARIAAIDGELSGKFPSYADMVSPAPLPAVEAQAALKQDEALILFFVTPELKPAPEETFITVVTKTAVRSLRSGLGSAALAREVKALRCGLDADAWAGPGCKELTGKTYTEADFKAGRPLPFEHARARKLYQALLGPAEDLIRGKHLLIVPSGALTQLPFQVLITSRQPARGDPRETAWLTHDRAPETAWLIGNHAITVLPAVSSLKALRRLARPSAAREPMVGFGNPLLEGSPDDSTAADAAGRARKLQSCPEKPAPAQGRKRGRRRGVAALETSGGLASVSFIRAQSPLPETAEELCAVRGDAGARREDIYLGAGATERTVKELSDNGRLANYRFVHFATHGALAGQVSGAAEPGLLLTPPQEATALDDGYLTASEIAGLKLDADWVILSACNTAAGGAQGAEALSGLARAFIYAQARALLVSHWAVDSAATVKLITGAVKRLKGEKPVSRAEALRRSMLAMIKNGREREAQPAYWAPFILVGEGSQ